MRFIVSALIATTALSSAQAARRAVVRGFAPVTRIVKMEPTAASGKCTPKSDADKAHDVMKRFDIDLVNGSASNRLALSRGLLEIERLAGGRFRPAEGATFKILPQRGCAQQMGKVIVLRQGCGSLDSVAYYVHELGHYIGNNDKAKLYKEYKETITSRCPVSNYALKDWTRARARNEEFAEVLAAFVTNPDLLLKSGPSCVKAYSFFRNRVFEDGELAGCGGGSKDTSVAQTTKPDPKTGVDLSKLTQPKTPDLAKVTPKPATPAATPAPAAPATKPEVSTAKPADSTKSANVAKTEAPTAKSATVAKSETPATKPALSSAPVAKTEAPAAKPEAATAKPTETKPAASATGTAAKVIKASMESDSSEVDFDDSEANSELEI